MFSHNCFQLNCIFTSLSKTHKLLLVPKIENKSKLGRTGSRAPINQVPRVNIGINQCVIEPFHYLIIASQLQNIRCGLDMTRLAIKAYHHHHNNRTCMIVYSSTNLSHLTPGHLILCFFSLISSLK